MNLLKVGDKFLCEIHVRINIYICVCVCVCVVSINIESILDFTMIFKVLN